MLANVLVVEKTEEFGSLIRSTLEETGQYQVELAISAAEAIEIGEQGGLQLLIIDFDLPDLDAPTCIQRILSANPGLALIAIPPNNNPNDPVLSGLPISTLLPKPFYLPELTRIVSEAIVQPSNVESSIQTAELYFDPREEALTWVSGTAAPWANDTHEATQHLTRICNDTSAEALILLYLGRPWAQAGEVSPSQAEEVATKINEIGVGEGSRGAITTVTHIPGMQRDCTLYADGLLNDWILAMIYPSGTSFSVIRRQAQTATDKLRNFDMEGFDEEPLPETTPVSPTAPFIHPIQVDDPHGPDMDPEQEIQEIPFLEDLDLPSPEPETSATAPPAAQPEVAETPAAIPGDWVPEVSKPESHLPFLEERPPSPAESTSPEPEDVAAASSAVQPEAAETSAEIPGDWVPEVPKPESHLPFLEERTASPVESASPAQEHIPLPDAEYYLPVSAVLVPRFPEQELVGALAENLNAWVVRLCLAWDWRADEVTIDPDYLCLTMSISPETPPSLAVERLRDDLSQRILSAFPEFVENLPSRRFWARSYLLITGGPPPVERVQAFVQSTRKGQGIEI